MSEKKKIELEAHVIYLSSVSEKRSHISDFKKNLNSEKKI